MLTRRTLLSAAALLGATVVQAAPPAAGGYKTITWDALVPKDWNPNDLFKDAPPASLQDDDPRAKDMLAKLREAWDNAPANASMDNTQVRLPGYLVPLEEANGQVSEFLLVPYFGACIHTPPPPANQIVHVLPRTPAGKFKAMDTVWVRGTLRVTRNASAMGTSGYRIDAVAVDKYMPSDADKAR
ncbi:MAG: DUF3299 domain-containing protein [Aquincola tertiaricarbonis]|uniref:DUF3299 domain-containing protein n=1 Tax=Aquincola tertiaricarbonis TaxID=391953 RepID=UPI000614B627|nr:DUF3299 domain-containing protein [Aquincola tertiaricarbonis]